MIQQVQVSYFKKFEDETFEITDSVILAGPNNTGKSTLLQAISVWSLALRKWLSERGPGSGSKASKRTGVAITRNEFTAIPLREMNLLWTNRSTALTRDELKGKQKLGFPRRLKINMKGRNGDSDWDLTFEFTYRFPDLIYASPAEETPIEGIINIVKGLQIVHVPPFSGIGPDEAEYTRAYQDHFIGQGKAGDIIRNLLLEVRKGKKGEWEKLCNDIRNIFNYTLLPPKSEGRPFILCEYQPGDIKSQKNLPKLDISCAGSGFLQVIMLLGFFYARPASLLLLDEPDAHLHVILQKQVYDKLREIARREGCKLLIATHSEVLVDGTSPEQILSFFKKPHKLLTNADRDQVREALKRLTSLDILMAEQATGVLYVEGDTDLNLLREWAKVHNHRAIKFFKDPFWHSNHGRNPREARAHFFALQAVNKKNIRGVLLLDGDNRQLDEHELSADGLSILRWRRYEAESYLVHPEALSRFLYSQQQLELFALKGIDYLKNELPPAVYKNPLSDHDYLNSTAASKTLLPGFFREADLNITRQEYYQIASQMLPEEIPDEVKEKLDLICKALGI